MALTLFAMRNPVICDIMFSDLSTKMSFQIQDKVFQHLVWKKCEDGVVPKNAFYTGANDSNEPLYVADLYEADPSECECVFLCEKTRPKKFKKLEWQNCMGGSIPKNAFDTGATDSGRIL